MVYIVIICIWCILLLYDVYCYCIIIICVFLLYVHDVYCYCYIRWNINSFFYNRKLKRVLVFYARQINDFNFDELNISRSGSVTPISNI